MVVVVVVKELPPPRFQKVESFVPGRELVPWTGDGTGGISQGLKLQTHKEPRNRDERSVVHAPPSGKPPIRAVVIGQRQ